jgi:hypothetical protein
MSDHAGVWDPIEDFPIAKLFMEEDFHCQDGTYRKSISAEYLRLPGRYLPALLLGLAGTPTAGAIAATHHNRAPAKRRTV